MMSNLRRRRATILAFATLAVLGGCGGGQEVYIAPNGQQLKFVSDQHVQWVGNYRDREWTAQVVRDSQGRIMSLEINHPDVGTREFRANDDGCLNSDRGDGPFCRQ